jgi:predicted component of type VI protein secretion system
VLLETRKKLIELQTNVDCNEKLEETLLQFMKTPEALKQIASSAGTENIAKEAE